MAVALVEPEVVALAGDELLGEHQDAPQVVGMRQRLVVKRLELLG